MFHTCAWQRANTHVECASTHTSLQAEREASTTTYIQKQHLCVGEVRLKGGAVVAEIGAVGCDGTALVSRTFGR